MAASPQARSRREALRADCGSCVALCCVALPFARSADFAWSKPAGEACANLGTDHRCTVHDRLRPSGFKGCTVFDCLGAGQKVTGHTFGGAGWRSDPGTRASMFAVFPVVRQLHEVLWYLEDARLATDPSHPAQAEITAAAERVERLTLAPAAEVVALDVEEVRAQVRPLLRATSERVRSQWSTRRRAGGRGAARRAGPGADLMGAVLRGADLRGVDLHGAYLIGADLSGCDLRGADLMGADLRDADVRDADLSLALYLTPMQVAAATGGPRTSLPVGLEPPSGWS